MGRALGYGLRAVRLALDTSTLTLSLALARASGEVVEHVVRGPPERQSVLLPAIVHELLTRHGVGLHQLSGFVVGLGPGSFTGLRIGLASLKGLAFALQRPIVGVSSLRAVAFEGPEGRTLWPIAQVKKGELYLGQYRREGAQVHELASESVHTVASLAALAAEHPDALLLGPAVKDYAAALTALGVAPQRLHEGPAFPSAVSLLALAGPLPAYDAQALFSLEPRYLRSSGAEDNPKFPPLPGLEPRARLKSEQD